MKRKSLLLIAALCVLLAVPQKARANDFLEKSKHYSAYASGVDKIHFKIPLFSESEAGYSYFVSTKEGLPVCSLTFPAMMPATDSCVSGRYITRTLSSL